jgi:DNA processing protein
MTRVLARSELIAWARLARTQRLGAISFHRLIALYKTPSAALEVLARKNTDLKPPHASRIEQELDALERMGARLLASCEPDYPALLATLDAPPPLLAVRGDARLLNRPTIAIVGAREASAAGLLLAERMAKNLGAAGFVIVSGLARGIDGAAHRGALNTGTVAVLAGGLDKPYPPQHLKLCDEIAGQGAVVSEAPLGFTARARDFPRRNHIVSGMSRGVLVIEAALRSGSLITARAAGEQGRDVLAIPGSPLDPRARGVNALIKNGAALVENAEDVIAVVGAPDAFPSIAPTRPLSAGPLFDGVEEAPPEGLTRRLLNFLSPTPVHVNDLARLCAEPSSSVAAALMELELAGRAASMPGGYAVSASSSEAGFSDFPDLD